jgi:bifunctional oligoribonuclease and PAP phosphatase NrnA
MEKKIQTLIDTAQHILIIQAENPDGDSLGSALALEEILGDLGKTVHLYCPVLIPKYLRYLSGWDRVQDELPARIDATIIVDTASETLLERALTPENKAAITKKPVIVIDHHVTPGNLPFEIVSYCDPACVATGELIFRLADASSWGVNASAADKLSAAILSDSLGLTTENTTADSIHTLGRLVELGANLSGLDAKRREYAKKTAGILTYKGQLLQRIEYYCDQKLALVHIPWEEIEAYSDMYNPSMLALDEMRLVENVRVAIAIKTYPDGRITGKIRANPGTKVAETIAGYFGGGGHPYAAGFRIYEEYETLKRELIAATDKILREARDAETA